jgi:hypothetical protein
MGPASTFPPLAANTSAAAPAEAICYFTPSSWKAYRGETGSAEPGFRRLG